LINYYLANAAKLRQTVEAMGYKVRFMKGRRKEREGGKQEHLSRSTRGRRGGEVVLF